jgi:hypothetical protein
VLVGLPDDLDTYLRSHPKICDEFRIAKLYPGGFVAAYTAGSGEKLKASQQRFNFQPGVLNTLYVKVGWETMACVKPLDLFIKECTLGGDVTAVVEDAEFGTAAVKTSSSAAPSSPSLQA